MENAREYLDKEMAVEKIKSSTKEEMDDLLVSIIKYKLTQEKDQHKLYEFFTYIYDSLYHDILFKRVSLDKQTIHMLEVLAMPIYDQWVINSFLSKLKIW